ncbi:hypothetical protein INR49_014264 [Caranx melampygus]|nr:hypothetical protein INR49_014264 [Caranx melampygus]
MNRKAPDSNGNQKNVTTIEKAAVNPRTPSPGSCTGLREANLGNKAVSLPVGNLDPPPCPPT